MAVRGINTLWKQDINLLDVMIIFWQVDIMIWQVNIKIWQVDIIIWQVDIIIWQVMAEICHHSFLPSSNINTISILVDWIFIYSLLIHLSIHSFISFSDVTTYTSDWKETLHPPSLQWTNHHLNLYMPNKFFHGEMLLGGVEIILFVLPPMCYPKSTGSRTPLLKCSNSIKF